jgi:hypothetical protein
LVEQPIRNRQVSGSSPLVGSILHAVKTENGMMTVSHQIQPLARQRDAVLACDFGLSGFGPFFAGCAISPSNQSIVNRSLSDLKKP